MGAGGGSTCHSLLGMQGGAAALGDLSAMPPRTKQVLRVTEPSHSLVFTQDAENRHKILHMDARSSLIPNRPLMHVVKMD